MENNLFQNVYNPDVLSCIANLSNDEVFTPPELANKIIDMLPQELFENPDTTFLDPCCKSGVFLREIAKRLIKGLAPQIPDLEKRIEHIFSKQIFGIAITELTSLLSRRSVYCSKYPSSEWSAYQFPEDKPQGNIIYQRIKHTWKDDKCVYCGASRSEYDRGSELETHAYQFIHNLDVKKVFNMKFDVIIGNPPYQMTFGINGGNSSNAKSIYNLFIDSAIKLNPQYVCMITPSRWMTKTAQGIPEIWVDNMLDDNKFRIIHDYEDVADCFPGISLTGGVSYFLWDKDYNGKCQYYYHKKHDKEIFEWYDYLDAKGAGFIIRDPQAYSIIEKIEAIDGTYYKDPDKNFSGLVSAKHFFDNSELLTSNWTGYKDRKDEVYNIKYYVNVDRERTHRWIGLNQLPKNRGAKDLHKVFIPAANGSMEYVLGKPFYGEPNSVCSQTFLVIGYDPVKHNLSEEECQNIIKYIQTRFFRYLVSIKKKTQNGPRGVYQFVPLQDFSKPWTDAELYAKYGLDDKEIAFIESMIRPME